MGFLEDLKGIHHIVFVSEASRIFRNTVDKVGVDHDYLQTSKLEHVLQAGHIPETGRCFHVTMVHCVLIQYQPQSRERDTHWKQLYGLHYKLATILQTHLSDMSAKIRSRGLQKVVQYRQTAEVKVVATVVEPSRFVVYLF